MAWTVAGQEHAVGILSAAVKNGRVAHAYLFAGPARVGKSLTAMQFAQLLNCTGGKAHAPCGECRSCEKIASASHPDVEFIGMTAMCNEREHDHAKDNSRDIRICQIRRVEQVLSRAPYEGRYRVIIIEPADSMNLAAVAALLKTLEEPPPNVVFVPPRPLRRPAPRPRRARPPYPLGRRTRPGRRTRAPLRRPPRPRSRRPPR